LDAILYAYHPRLVNGYEKRENLSVSSSLTGSTQQRAEPPSGNAAAAKQGLLHVEVVFHAVVGGLPARDARGKLAEVGDLERAGWQVDATPVGLTLAVDLDRLHVLVGQVTAAQ